MENKKKYKIQSFFLKFFLFIVFISSLVIIPNVAVASTPVRKFGISVWRDQACTNPVNSIDWGQLSPGGSTNKIIYIRNDGSDTIPSLYMTTSDWNPSNAARYIHLTWDYNGQSLSPGLVIKVTLTLSVDSNIVNITSFTFNINIGDPDVARFTCFTPGTDCDGKYPYDWWCDDVTLKRCRSDCFFLYDMCSSTCDGDTTIHAQLKGACISTSNDNTKIDYCFSLPKSSCESYSFCFWSNCLSYSSGVYDKLNCGRESSISECDSDSNCYWGIKCKTACSASQECDGKYPETASCYGNIQKGCDYYCKYVEQDCTQLGYVCQDGYCLGSCASNQQCSSSYVCDI